MHRMPLPPEMLEWLVCPKSKAPLVYFPRGESDDDEAAAFLLCPVSRMRYGIVDGVANLVIEDGEELSPREVDRLVSRARELRLAIP
jgi:uncharacterized protein YbaR (Trm112 family)